MTLASTPPTISYIENGVTTVHAVPFQFFASSELVVERIVAGAVTTLALGSGYTVTGGAGSTGSITKTNGGTSGATLRIRRATARTQPTDYTPGDRFPAESHERGLDRNVAMVQEVEARHDDLDGRSLRVPPGESAAVLPAAASRVETLLGFGSAGARELLSYAALAARLLTPLLALLPAAFKGDPGGNVESIGLKATAGALTVPAGTDRVRTAGYSTPGVGMADYVRDADADAAGHPRAVITFADGAKFRLAETIVTPFMFGAIDAAGTIKGADETVTDCSDALDAMWEWVKDRLDGIVMDLSMAQGLGVSRPWHLVGGLGTAWWNCIVYRIRPGRLVAMEEMDDIVVLEGKDFHCEGRWELWGGTDATAINIGYSSYKARNGMRIKNAGSSRIGDIECIGVRRYALQFDKTNDPATNNNIPIMAGQVKAIGCGSKNNSSETIATANEGFGGTFTGTWEDAPAQNASNNQRHLMTLTPAAGVDPGDVEVGDFLFVGEKASEGVITEIVSSTATTVTVRVWPWQAVETGGTFVCLHGGSVSAWGADIANSTFDEVYALDCGTALQVSCLYAPQIRSLLAESVGCAIQIGSVPELSMEGLVLDQYHMEGVGYTFVDVAAASTAFRFGSPSNLHSTAAGKFGKARRLSAGAASGSGGTFEGYTSNTLRGMSFQLDCGVVHSGSGGSPAKEGDSAPYVSPLPFYGDCPPSNRDSLTITLHIDRSMARLLRRGRECRFGPIYGSGTNGAPTGNVTIQVDPAQAGDTTIDGGAGPIVLTSTDGAIMGVAIYEPGAGDAGNWRVASWKAAMTS